LKQFKGNEAKLLKMLEEAVAKHHGEISAVVGLCSQQTEYDSFRWLLSWTATHNDGEGNDGDPNRAKENWKRVSTWVNTRSSKA
jgi:hypothetical protein